MLKMNIFSFVKCILIHHEPQYAEAAANIMAEQWGHKEAERARNIKNMIEESKDTLPCHLALLLNSSHLTKSHAESNPEINKTSDTTNEEGKDIVVGHVKLTRAAGRGDGACCISYSLVVGRDYRGLGLGRILTEEAEKYARSLSYSYMYLSTNDKVGFYEHLGYKQCEAVSSLGSNSKKLTSTQVSSLEGLFAKRLNICNPMNCNTWLRKRLLYEYPLKQPEKIENLCVMLTAQIEQAVYDDTAVQEFMKYNGIIILMPWQQQTGPSCGIAALNMVKSYFEKIPFNSFQNCSRLARCDCIGKCKTPPQSHQQLSSIGMTALEVALQLQLSHDGEMFCANNLAFLAERFHGMDLVVRDLSESTGTDICKSIQKGLPIIIPYDRNLGNHLPGCFGGEHAHWAIIIGFIIPSLISSETSQSVDCVLNLTSVVHGQELGECLDTNQHNLLLICSHGMSANPFICSLKNLKMSNMQLRESKCKYYLAPKDLKHLRNKIIFFG